MATIQTTIQLTDGMSPVLRAINQSLNGLIERFDNIDRALDRAFNPAAIQRTAPAIQQTATAQQNVTTQINNSTNSQNKFNESVNRGGSSVSNLVGKITALVGVYSGVQAMGSIISTTDQLTSTTARLNMVNDGLQTTEELQEKIFQAAQRSRGEYAATADAVAKLGLRAGSIFTSNDETIAFTETLNKMFVIAGATQAEMSSATLQLTQALGSGVLRGEEFNAVFEAAPNVMQAVADYMGKPIGALREMAKEGEITAQIVKEALLGSSEEVNRQFDSMPVTFAQSWVNMKNNFLSASQPILQALSEITSSERFKRFADGVGEAVERVIGFFQNVGRVVMPILDGLFTVVEKIGNFFSENWDMIAPIIWAVVIPMAALKTISMAVATWTTIVAAATAIKNTVMGIAAARTAMVTGATFAQTAAQYGLNTALLACPMTWIVLAIIALIAVFYLAVAAVNKFAGTSYSATGFICAAFMGLYTSVYNNIANLWNTFAAFAEFIWNLFVDPTYACKKLFVDLASVVLDTISSMTSGWAEHAKGVVDVMTKAINGVLRCYNAFANSWLGRQIGINPVQLTSSSGVVAGLNAFNNRIAATKASMQAWLGEAPENAASIPRMELKNMAESLASGYASGADFEAKAEAFMSGMDPSEQIRSLEEQMAKYTVEPPGAGAGAGTGAGAGAGNAENVANALDNALDGNSALNGLTGNAEELAKEAANLSNQLSLSTEEMNAIRQQAQREILNQVTRNNIEVQITNNNEVRDGVDVQSMARELARQVQQEIEASSEGVRR